MRVLRIASDLHLEHFKFLNAKDIISKMLPEGEVEYSNQILILAGDISSRVEQLLDFLDECAKTFYQVIAIPGNHESYGHDINLWRKQMVKDLPKHKNLFYAENDAKCVVIDNTRFIFGILWADGGSKPLDEILVSRALNDFRIIRNGDGPFSVADMKLIHENQKTFIRNTLSEPFSGKTVVISHHLPSYTLVSERFAATDLSKPDINGGFASKCDDIIQEFNPNLWIHGHTHDTIDRMIGSTRIICNPRGYPNEFMNSHNHFSNICIRLDEL